MAALGEILRRFRFHGVPGSPVAVAVPGDRAAELGGEVAPLFSLLQDTQDAATALLAEAEQEAARIRAEGAELSRQLIEASRARAGAAREHESTRIRATASAQCAAVLTTARGEAERIEQLGAARAPALVAEVVRRVLALGVAP